MERIKFILNGRPSKWSLWGSSKFCIIAATGDLSSSIKTVEQHFSYNRPWWTVVIEESHLKTERTWAISFIRTNRQIRTRFGLRPFRARGPEAGTMAATKVRAFIATNRQICTNNFNGVSSALPLLASSFQPSSFRIFNSPSLSLPSRLFSIRFPIEFILERSDPFPNARDWEK